MISLYVTMGPIDLLRHPLIFSGITLPEFIRWYFLEQPLKIIRSYFAYLRASVEIFSFVFLIRTLFSPWRQIASTYSQKGFNLKRFFESLSLNMVSRAIGFLFRMTTIALGVVALLALTTGFIIFLFGWLLFPLLFWIGASYIVSGIF